VCLWALLAAWPADAATCEGLSKLQLPHAIVTSAVVEQSTICRVAVTLQPTADSEIRMEVWLPASAEWNGKLLAYGNGGWSGSVSQRTLAAGLRRGYATTMSDTGHQGSSASFAFGHPEKLKDFGYRAAHENAVAAKAIVEAYYGKGPRLSYWSGCSAGGRQALMEAQRYPADFNGIIAGAPGLHWTGRAIQAITIAQASHRDAPSYLPPAKYRVLHDAALQACDAKDGAADGVLEDPTQCTFDPKKIECKDAADAPHCLTPAQVATARTIYAPTLHRRTKAVVTPGYERGSELGWATMGGPKPFPIAIDLFRYVVFERPDWDYRTFDFADDLDRTERAAAGTLNATDPNLRAFFDSGGKLIQYHGWNDPQIAPGFSVDYYRRVLDEMGGPARVQRSMRLFMVPGMAHCGGGEGTSTFDMLTALEQWVERGEAPNSIPASRVRDGNPDRTRPLCPYPQLAAFQGTGSIDDAANFRCRAR
jgi:feruloyl esterase